MSRKRTNRDESQVEQVPEVAHPGTRPRVKVTEGGATGAQIRELRALVERQQAQIEALQARLDSMGDGNSAVGRTESRDAATRTDERTGVTSRRRLLAGAGAAAAAATVALVASEGQSAYASPAADGDIIHAGQTTTAVSTTTLQADSSSTATALLSVDSTTAAVAGVSIAGTANNGGVGVNGVGIGGSGAGTWGVGGYYSRTGTEAPATVRSSLQNRAVNPHSGLGPLTLGYAVAGYSEEIDIGALGSGRLFQWPVSTSESGEPSINGVTGEQVRDGSGEMWLCVAGSWVRVAHAVFGYTGGATSYLSKPIRLLDTRGSDPNAQHNGGGMISSGTPYTLQIAGVNWMSVQVPANAVGAIGKLTVISGASSSGFVSLVPSGSGSPTTGTLPYGASQTLATAFNVGLGGSPGAIDIYVGGTPVDVVIDLFAVVA